MVALVLSSGRARVSHGTQQRVVVLHAGLQPPHAKDVCERCYARGRCSARASCHRVALTCTVVVFGLLLHVSLLPGRCCVRSCCFQVVFVYVLVAFGLLLHVRLLLSC